MTRAITWKRIGIFLLLAFFIYFVVQSPEESANSTKAIFTAIGDVAGRFIRALTTFLQTLF